MKREVQGPHFSLTDTHGIKKYKGGENAVTTSAKGCIQG